MQNAIAFILELDKLKRVTRKSRPIGLDRFENSAEHSWQIALFAHALSAYAPPGCDINRVIRMLLVHDLGEIDAGDVPFHAPETHAGQQAGEQQAAERLFGLLPPAQASEFRDLWDEFEAAISDDAKFAKALDRFQPMIHNAATDGGTWVEMSVTLEQIKTRCQPPISGGAPALWTAAEAMAEAHYRE